MRKKNEKLFNHGKTGPNMCCYNRIADLFYSRVEDWKKGQKIAYFLFPVPI